MPPIDEPPPAQLRLTGTPALLLAGQAERHLDRQAALVAAVLALQGPQPRLRLAQQLWPEVPESRARANLRQCLYRLKAADGAAWVVGDAALALAASVQVLPVDDPDAGELLAGVPAPESGMLALWLEQARSAARAGQLRTLAARAQQAEAARRFEDALTHVRRMLAIEPLAEAHHRELMRLHYLRGDNRAALSAHQHLREMLAREFGAAPDAQSQALLHLVSQALAAPAAVPTSPTAAWAPAALQRPPRLAAREAELGTLAGALRGRATVLLTGEAGVGKSRLLHALAELHGIDAVLRVAGRPGDADVPFALASRWLRAATSAAASDPGLLDAHSRAALAQLLPEWGAADRGEPGQHAGRLRAAAQALLQRAIHAGVTAVFVDDLHHADDASIELLQALPEPSACAWLLALRPGEGGAVLQRWVQALQQASDTHTLALQPLDAAGVQQLLDAVGGTPAAGAAPLATAADAHTLHRLTGGNPLFVLETLKAMAAQPSPTWPTAPTVLRLIQQRLARLSAPALQLARCAAVLGQDLSPALAARMLGQRPLDLADAWAELETAQVLKGEAFAHDLVEQAAREMLPAAIARPLHADAALLLEQAGGAPARVAEHWLAAGQPLKAAPALFSAARHAAKLWRIQEAALLAQRAAVFMQAEGQHRPAFEAWFFAAEMHSDLENLQAVQHCEQAMSALAEDDGQRASLACVSVFCLVQTHQIAQAVEMAQTALPLAERAGLPEIEVELHWDLAVLAWKERDAGRATRHVERAMLRLDAVLPERSVIFDPAKRRLQLLDALGVIACASGQLEQGQRRLAEAHELAVQMQHRHQACNTAYSLTVMALVRGDAGATRHWLERCRAQVPAGREELASAQSFAMQAAMHALAPLGALGEALALADEMSAFYGRRPAAESAGMALIGAQLHHQLGRSDLAVKALHALDSEGAMAPMDRALHTALRLAMGQRADPQPLLQLWAGKADLPTRTRLLWLAWATLPAPQAQALLGTAADEARAQGADGLWLMLNAARLAAWRACGDGGDEAVALALAVWARQQQGLIAPVMFPAIAAELCATLATTHTALAETVALRAGAWMLEAAATLPPAWRRNYLTRAPLLQVLPPRERGLLFGLAV